MGRKCFYNSCLLALLLLSLSPFIFILLRANIWFYVKSDINILFNERPSTLVKSVAVLVQRSPVKPDEQLNRLLNIDLTWAKISTHIGRMASVNFLILAVVQREQKPGIPFRTLRLLNSSSRVPWSPFHNIVKSIFDIFASGELGSVKPISWLVLVNDHTFVLMDNMERFLSAKNPDDLIYSGNKLLTSYSGEPLYFASGGAGAIVSHTIAKAMLIIWTLSRSELIASAYSETIGSNIATADVHCEGDIFNQYKSDANDLVHLDISTNSPPSTLLCVLRYLWNFDQSLRNMHSGRPQVRNRPDSRHPLLSAHIQFHVES